MAQKPGRVPVNPHSSCGPKRLCPDATCPVPGASRLAPPGIESAPNTAAGIAAGGAGRARPVPAPLCNFADVARGAAGEPGQCRVGADANLQRRHKPIETAPIPPWQRHIKLPEPVAALPGTPLKRQQARQLSPAQALTGSRALSCRWKHSRKLRMHAVRVA